MKIKRFTASFILLLTTFFINAQVSVRDTINGKTLTMESDSRVGDLLDDMASKCKKTPSSVDTDYNKPSTTISNNSTSTKPKTVVTNGGSITVVKKPMTAYEICKQNPRMQGFKIQVTLAKSADEAQKIRQYIRNRLPDIKVEIDGNLRPNYKILAGSYFTKESAASDIRRIRAYFDRAIPIPYRVFCVESK